MLTLLDLYYQLKQLSNEVVEYAEAYTITSQYDNMVRDLTIKDYQRILDDLGTKIKESNSK